MTTDGQFIQSVDGYKSVRDFYRGKSVFITGGTGFLGKSHASSHQDLKISSNPEKKVLLEKLLFSCTEIGQIFILIRNKKGVEPEERIKEMIDTPLFSRIKAERPEDLNKLTPIAGDISLPYLGLSSSDEEKLIDKVSVVIHMAARIKFHEKLNLAVESNVKGTEYVLNLCHRMKDIKAFVHVSTAYINTNEKILQEKVYPPRVELNEVLKFIEQPIQDKQEIEKRFLKGLPNTYTLTKRLAENYVFDHHGNIPTAIMRPSVVSPIFKEPIEGWTDNWFGATGFIVTTMKGLNRVIFGRPDTVLDVIPVDYVVNATIVAATKCSSSETLTVYNCCSSSCNPLTAGNFFNDVKKAAIATGFHDNSYPTLTFTNKKWLLLTLTFLLETIPAYLADGFLRLMGKKPKYVKLHSKVIKIRSLLNFFTFNSWELKADNVKSLFASLSLTDKKEFPCDPSDIDWEKYSSIYLLGLKKYLVK